MKVKVYTCLGRRPIPKCAEISKSTLREVLKVALGPCAADGLRHTPSLRRARSFACFHFFLSRARGLDAASSGAAAASQCYSSWNQRLFFAARRHCRCLSAVQQHARRQLKTVCGLRQVRSLRMLIPAMTTSTSAWHTKLFRCATLALLWLTAQPAAFAEHATDQSVFSLSRHAV